MGLKHDPETRPNSDKMEEEKTQDELQEQFEEELWELTGRYKELGLKLKHMSIDYEDD